MGLRAVDGSTPLDARPGTGEPFTDLVLRFGPCLRALAFRRLGDAAAAEDVVQETFLRAYRARSSIELDAHLWPWLATVATNICIDRGRRGWSREVPLHERDVARGQVADGYDDCVARETRDAINDVLSKINGRHRRILLLRAEEGWSHADIARAEGITIEAVKSALKRSRSSFRRMYRDAAFEDAGR